MAEERNHVYESAMLGLPALKMVLVHARNDAQNAAAPVIEPPFHPLPSPHGTAPLAAQEAIRKLIEHLEESGE